MESDKLDPQAGLVLSNQSRSALRIILATKKKFNPKNNVSL